MRLISDVLQRWTLNQGEELSHVVQHYMSLENSDWHIFCTNSWKRFEIFVFYAGERLFFLHNCSISWSVCVYPSAVLYSLISPLISHLALLKCTIIFSSSLAHPFVSSHDGKPQRDWRCRTGTGQCFAVWGTSYIGERKAREWQLAHHIRGCLYMCVHTHTRAILCAHTIIRALQPVSHKAAAAQAHRLEACNPLDAISEWKDGWMDQLTIRPCCLILNYITINMDIKYLNHKALQIWHHHFFLISALTRFSVGPVFWMHDQKLTT